MTEKISISAAANRLVMLETREQELRAQMQKLCSQYGLLTQELFIIIEAMKSELREEIKDAERRTVLPRNFAGYLVD